MSRLTLALLTLGLAATACQKTTSSQAGAASAGAPVASWKGGSVTTGELDAQTYDQRKQALDQLVVKKLVEQKAKDEKITSEELFKREVQDKATTPSDEEMKSFYDEQAKRQPLPPFEEVKEQIAQFMARPQLQKLQQAFTERLKAEYAVTIALRPPKVEVAAEGGPSKGASGAKVTIVEFSDFECPYCSTAEETVKRVMKEYEGKVRLVYRDYPLPFHPNAGKAAEAAHCAGDQDKYWEMHEKLFANQKALAPDALKGHAKELGLDQGKFDTCLDKGEKAAMVESNRKEGEKVGVTGTPAFFINGYMLSGAQPFEEFKSLIDAELAAK